MAKRLKNLMSQRKVRVGKRLNLPLHRKFISQSMRQKGTQPRPRDI